jgi:hypothetical protein
MAESWHHTHDGLYFARGENREVYVRLVWDDEDVTHRRTVKLTSAEWASVVTEVSATEDGLAFEMASRLHAGTLETENSQNLPASASRGAGGR